MTIDLINISFGIDKPNIGDITIRDIKKIWWLPQNHKTVVDSDNLSVSKIVL